MELNDLLEEAKLKYPVGTKFKCVNGNTDTGIINSIFTVKATFNQNPILKQYSDGRIHSENGWIYLDGKWAEIIEEPITKTIDKDYKYLIKLFKKLNIK